MTVASLGAMALGIYNCCTAGSSEGMAEACIVVILNRVGEYFEDWATERSRKSIAGLMDMRPDHVRLESGEIVAPETVTPGTIIIVKKGERVPLDGILQAEGAQKSAVHVKASAAAQACAGNGAAEQAAGAAAQACAGNGAPAEIAGAAAKIQAAEKAAAILDMMALTGESEPVAAHPGDEILSGSVNMGGAANINGP